MVLKGVPMALKIVYQICCGIDVHKTFVVACIASTNKQGVTTYKRHRFSTLCPPSSCYFSNFWGADLLFIYITHGPSILLHQKKNFFYRLHWPEGLRRSLADGTIISQIRNWINKRWWSLWFHSESKIRKNTQNGFQKNNKTPESFQRKDSGA